MATPPNPAQVARDLRSAIRDAESTLAELELVLGPPPTADEARSVSLSRPLRLFQTVR